MPLLKHYHNIHSWVTGITGTLFTESLKYQDGPRARYGGDVSKVTWKDDRNGNITTLQRYGRTGASTYGRIDYLTLTYSGNRLSTVKDTGSAAYSNDFRYSNTTSTTYSYTYDAAGRMKKDAAKGISSITWNVLGLPQTVTFSSGVVINYSYAADGTKLREARTASGTTTTTDYTGTLVLEDGTRSRMLFDGGYISMSDNAYHFFLTDHLGSVRVVANSNGVAEEYNHYYPLGGLLPTSTSITGIQPLKYQGKEWAGAKGLNLYDFGARRYDPATGRWLSQDPLAEKYYGHSPYLFCAANPMRYVDPEGRAIVIRDNQNNSLSEFEWREIDGKWGFYDENDAIYSGKDQYIYSASMALSTLMMGKEGAAMIKEIVGRSERVLIGMNRDGSNDYYPSSKTIAWNPEKSLIGASFLSLGHEMAHALDDLRGTINKSVWIPQGEINGYKLKKSVPNSEIFATHIENQIRREQGFPLRETYLSGEKSPFLIWSRIIDPEGKSLYYDVSGSTTYKWIPPSQRFKY